MTNRIGNVQLHQPQKWVELKDHRQCLTMSTIKIIASKVGGAKRQSAMFNNFNNEKKSIKSGRSWKTICNIQHGQQRRFRRAILGGVDRFVGRKMCHKKKSWYSGHSWQIFEDWERGGGSSKDLSGCPKQTSSVPYIKRASKLVWFVVLHLNMRLFFVRMERFYGAHKLFLGHPIYGWLSCS